MFDESPDESVDKSSDECNHELKKRKLENPSGSKPLHKSLGYSSIKTPPFVEYGTINSYCENKLGKSLSSNSSPIESPSTSSLYNVQHVSSPVVFKTPKLPKTKPTFPINLIKPYIFFSVEELSLVTCLKNWSNTKVCAVGNTTFDRSSQQCYLNSKMEKGRWKLLLDTSLLPQIPRLETLVQVFGSIEVTKNVPILQIHFCRYLGLVELPLFIESYKLIQKFIPQSLAPVHKLDTNSNNESELDNENEEILKKLEHKLNDTLDDYDFSQVV